MTIRPPIIFTAKPNWNIFILGTVRAMIPNATSPTNTTAIMGIAICNPQIKIILLYRSTSSTTLLVNIKPAGGTIEKL